MCLLVILSVEKLSVCFFFFQAEDGIRDLVRSRGLGDVYKRQLEGLPLQLTLHETTSGIAAVLDGGKPGPTVLLRGCLLYTSDAADERSSVDLGGRRIIKKKTQQRSIAPR